MERLRCLAVALIANRYFSVHAAVVRSPDPLADSLQVQANLGNFLQGTAISFADAFIETVADTEMGRDIAAEFDASTARDDSGGDGELDEPANLEQYCAGPTKKEKHAKLKKGTKVMADWRDYGTMYPGRIKDKHHNGTVDIKYDDGFTEDDVEPSDIKVIKTEKKTEVSEEKKGKPRDDPACELLEYVKQLKKKYGKLNDMLSQWLLAQRARVAKGKSPEPPPSMKPVQQKVAPPPSPAMAQPDGAVPPAGVAQDPDKASELEDLKKQLADRDEYIARLKKKEKENDEALREEHGIPLAAAPAPAVKTIDDLISEYKAQIEDRDKEIERLKLRIARQEQELARLGAQQMTVEELAVETEELVVEAEKVEVKREELEKEDKLDDDLRHIVDKITEAIKKMEKKVAHLVELEKEAEERKAKAEKEAAEARAIAEAQAQKDGKSKEEVEKIAAEAEKVAEKNVEKESKAADMETLRAAQDVESHLKEAEKSTTHLDTGLHPHGAKWWRYRYEHSYIEALIMVFIVILYLFWNVFNAHLKYHVQLCAKKPDEQRTREEEEMEETNTLFHGHHGTMYMIWLHRFAEQMMVCICVFLTVWIIAQTPLLHIVPQLIRPSDDMRVPSTGQEYRVLAFDICTIFFFAIDRKSVV